MSNRPLSRPDNCRGAPGPGAATRTNARPGAATRTNAGPGPATHPRRLRRSLAVGLTVLIAAVALSACGSFDSAASGQNLIKDYIKKRGQGHVTLKSVSCPSGIKQQVGGSYNCKVTLHLVADNTDHSGTITIHMASGNKVVIEGAQDVHVQ